MTNRAGVMEKVCVIKVEQEIFVKFNDQNVKMLTKNDVRRIGDMMLRSEKFWLTNIKKSATKFDF